MTLGHNLPIMNTCAPPSQNYPVAQFVIAKGFHGIYQLMITHIHMYLNTQLLKSFNTAFIGIHW